MEGFPQLVRTSLPIKTRGMNLWNLSNKQLKEKGAENIAREICQQPDAREDTLRILEDEKKKLRVLSSCCW